MRFDLVTLHPEILVPFASEGIIRGAQDKGLIQIHLHDVRLFSPDDGGIVDDRPFGGGAGMVMRPEPFGKAIEAISRQVGKRPYVVLLSAQGVLFTQGLAKELARQPAVALLCGRYEGVDERIAGLSDLELSIG
ncbi:MAG TPA: tRNA (guanosine(37)-N1)-methyltransferase TrmD, partial [Candidatus Acetothermia bacterium]|nr:tRNA (guanosine(37)-N1)-methyltransferase TrmD [Candidatus Acetothermia bacterium]